MAAKDNISDSQMREHLARLQLHTGTRVHPTGAIQTSVGNVIPAVGHKFMVNSNTGNVWHIADIWNEKTTHYQYMGASRPKSNHRASTLEIPEASTGDHKYVLSNGRIGVSYPETDPPEVRRKNISEFLDQHVPAEHPDEELRNSLSQTPHIATVWHSPKGSTGYTEQRFNLKTGTFEQD